MAPTIRTPRLDELERLRAIERAAGALFVDVGLAEIADADPISVESLTVYVVDGRAWTVVGDDDVPVGYAVVDDVDRHAHLEQLSVVPEHARRGLGHALLEHVCTWAAGNGFGAVTLTTFRDVPWNAPFYAKHGFTVLPDHEIGPELRALRAHESAVGLDPLLRVCMRREVSR